MQVIQTGISDLLVLEPRVFRDERGYFVETYNQRRLLDLGITNHFVQDNESLSGYGTIRGLHFQNGPHAQAKLVRVIQGEVLDVAVDLRPDSSTYGKPFSVVLNSENKRMLFVPRGFAHGFSVLSETAIFAYKCDNFYAPADEGGLLFSDPDLGIDWRIPQSKILLSEKDRHYPRLKDLTQRT